MMKPFFITGMAVALTASMTMAADQRSLEEIGQDLFYNPALGDSTNELSCSSCHSNGYRLESATANPNLMQAIRKCLVNELGGSAKGGMVEMKALRAYVLELSNDLLVTSDDPPDMTRGFRPGDPLDSLGGN